MTDKEELINIDENPFPTAAQDVEAAGLTVDTPQTRSSTYQLAYTDQEFLLRDELRPVRLQLELLKPDLIQSEEGIESTIVIFGSARIPERSTAEKRLKKATRLAGENPDDARLQRRMIIAQRVLDNSRYYDEARELASIITEATLSQGRCEMVVITGGGPGIMEAANRGAMEAGGKSIGLNIVLPFEQRPNAYITPELCFQFHYFAIRKMHFLKRARALVACPGGFGTMDELFETITLIQTRKIKPVPILLLGSDYWRRIINFQAMVDEGTIDETDLGLFRFVDSAEEAWQVIKKYYDL
ncbi:MAG: TIGR00730 family Rossman fold protein [Gammaproteobacteria bacterium]|nr:TIGR00730 family Rossman fold protein [Gammaproteobacteria bacterium]